MESMLAMELEQGHIARTITTETLTGSKDQIHMGDNKNHLVSSVCKYCSRRSNQPNLYVEFSHVDVEFLTSLTIFGLSNFLAKIYLFYSIYKYCK